MSETAHVITGRCTTVFEGSRDTGGCKFVKIFEPPWGRNSSVSYSHQYEQEQHGDMIVLIKPDSTS